MKDFAKLQEVGNNEKIINEIDELYRKKSYDINCLKKLFEVDKPDIEKCDAMGNLLRREELKIKEELEKGEK